MGTTSQSPQPALRLRIEHLEAEVQRVGKLGRMAQLPELPGLIRAQLQVNRSLMAALDTIADHVLDREKPGETQ